MASYGVDTNPCSVGSPCRSFTRALTQTDANGEVIVLDSASYGTSIINQSASIVAPPGVYAGISVFAGQQGIVVNGAGIKVGLRGLTVNGQGGATGVWFSQGSQLVMEDCTVRGMTKTGILISAAWDATLNRLRVENNRIGIGVVDGGTVSVSRSVIHGHGGYGCIVQANFAAIPTRGAITDSVLSHNRVGIYGLGTVVGALVRVVAARNQVVNGDSGIGGQGSNCADAACVQVVATDNVVQDMAARGIEAFGGSTVVASRSTVTNSATGLSEPATGTFISMQDNVSELNTTNTGGTITPGTLR